MCGVKHWCGSPDEDGTTAIALHLNDPPLPVDVVVSSQTLTTCQASEHVVRAGGKVVDQDGTARIRTAPIVIHWAVILRTVRSGKIGSECETNETSTSTARVHIHQQHDSPLDAESPAIGR